MLLGIYLFSIVVCALSCVCVKELTKRQAKEYEMTKSKNREPASLLLIQLLTSLFLMLCPVLNTFCALVMMYSLNNEELRDDLVEKQLDRCYED